jgi:hypothetical protein
MKNSDSDTFVVALQGELIHCDNLQDAIAIKNASDVLGERGDDYFSTRELDEMADALTRYNWPGDARIVRGISAKRRATEYLVQSVGYERPAAVSLYGVRSRPEIIQ